MSSGNCTTEYTRREALEDEAVIVSAALVRNAVLRRALAIAAHEVVRLRSGGLAALPDAGVALMLCWVMEAAEAVQAN